MPVGENCGPGLAPPYTDCASGEYAVGDAIMGVWPKAAADGAPKAEAMSASTPAPATETASRRRPSSMSMSQWAVPIAQSCPSMTLSLTPRMRSAWQGGRVERGVERG